MYGGLLDLDEWKERYDDLQNQLAVSIIIYCRVSMYSLAPANDLPT
jgi:condensin complex subunit 1